MSFALAAVVWVVLSWQGGLHPWQQAMASLGLAVLVWSDRRRFPAWYNWSATERILGCLLLVQACCVGSSLRPQNSLNAVAGLGLVLVAALLLRRRPGTTTGRVAVLLQIGGAVYAAAFLGLGLWTKVWEPTLADPVTVARWLSPNQNLLASGLALPAFFLGVVGLADPAHSIRRKLGDGLCAGLGALALVYAGSRGAYACMGVASVWLALRWAPNSRRRLAVWLAPALLMVVVLGLWAPFSRLAVRLRAQATSGLEDVNYYRRFDFWKGAAGLSLERPLLGQGLDCFGAAAYALDLPSALTPTQPIARYRLSLEHAHDDWLELAVEAGWPCVLFLALCACGWLGRRWRCKGASAEALGLEAVLVTAGALSLVDMNLRTPGLAWGLILCFCALEPVPDAREGRGLGAWAALGAAALAVFCLGGAALAHSFRQDRQAGLATGTQAQVALCLQPLDATLAAEARGLAPVWPWSAWAGRANPYWWWSEALHESDPAAQALAARHAVALRPYYAPGWYWLGLKLAQNGQGAGAFQAMDRALTLEPNFVQVLAWQAQQARNRGAKDEEKKLEQRLHAVEALKTQDKPDAYTRYIQSGETQSFTR